MTPVSAVMGSCYDVFISHAGLPHAMALTNKSLQINVETQPQELCAAESAVASYESPVPSCVSYGHCCLDAMTGGIKPFAAQLARRLGGDEGTAEASLKLRAFVDRDGLKPGDDADKVMICPVCA